MTQKIFGEKVEGRSYKYREGVYAIIQNSSSQVATVKTPLGYFLPGGGIESGENHEEALKRELKEETGYDSTICDYINTYTQFTLGKSKPTYYELVGNYYECKLGAFLNCKIEDDHELVWLDLNRATDELQMEYQRYALKAFNEDKV